jgi:hypothetical protein
MDPSQTTKKNNIKLNTLNITTLSFNLHNVKEGSNRSISIVKSPKKSLLCGEKKKRKKKKKTKI